MNVCDKYKNELRLNRPVVYAELTFQPLKVSDYALYLSAKPSFELMQASLPPALARLSWMPCLDELDKKYRAEEGKESGYFLTALTVIATALQPGYMDDPQIVIDFMRDEEGRLKRIAVQLSHSEPPVFLSCQQLSDIRYIIAAQNGYDVPDENWNLDLMRTQKYLQAVNSTGSDLKVNIESLVSSVAANIGCRSQDIWDWSIREFTEMQDAIDRKLGFLIYRSAELNGAKFEGGSPFPTWKYSREALPTGSRNLEDVEKTAAPMLANVNKE